MVKKRNKRPPHVNPLAGELGTFYKNAAVEVALGYPAPYAVGASSLGAQTVYRTWNSIEGLSCTRFFMPDGKEIIPRPLVTLESEKPVADATAIAFSVACETELLGVVALLFGCSLSPLRSERRPTDPPIIIGGPITYLDPRLVAPLADLVVVGEAEGTLLRLGQQIVATPIKADLLDAFNAEKDPAASTVWLPGICSDPPPPVPVATDLLPARATTWSPNAELTNLFLVEATRGCKRGCSFCVLSARTENPSPFRAVPTDSILSAIPEDAPGVGLVGAAVTDHPDIESLVAAIVDRGKRVSLSSIRADQLTRELARQLKRGGLRTLTIAADGCSDPLRRAIHKGIEEVHLLDAASLARSVGLRGIKVYTMLGLPGEMDEDVLTFGDLMKEMAKSLRVSVAAQAFVPKPGTPLSAEPMAPPKIIRQRLALLRKIAKGRFRVLPTSARWSWLDWKLAGAKELAALIAIDAYQAGGQFSAWRDAVTKHLGGTAVKSDSNTNRPQTR